MPRNKVEDQSEKTVDMPEISDERLKTAWTLQLREDWESANDNYFKGAMRLLNLEFLPQSDSWGGGKETITERSPSASI